LASYPSGKLGGVCFFFAVTSRSDQIGDSLLCLALFFTDCSSPCQNKSLRWRSTASSSGSNSAPGSWFVGLGYPSGHFLAFVLAKIVGSGQQFVPRSSTLITIELVELLKYISTDAPGPKSMILVLAST